MASPTAFIVDDDPVVRQILELVLRNDGIETASFASAEAFLEACPPDRPGCLILDLRLPNGMDGLQLQREMAARGYGQAIVTLTAHGDIPTTVTAIKAGAVDVLLKPVKNDTLLAAVRSAFATLGPAASDNAAHDPQAPEHRKLTDREREIVRLAIEGKSSKEIGKLLGISHRTVEVHRAHALEKTGARNILEIAHKWWNSDVNL